MPFLFFVRERDREKFVCNFLLPFKRCFQLLFNDSYTTMDIPDLLSSLTEEERAWVAKLQSPELGQEHLIKAAASADDIRNIVQQLKPFDASYPGGLLGYVQKARGLLREAKDNVNPLKGYKAEVPLRERLGTGTQRFLDFEKLGLSQLQYAAFVLVAGGLGERLGCFQTKISLPTQIVTNTTFIEYYAQLIFACQTEVKRLAGKQLDLPLVIMTSDDTHNSTLALLDENRYFGLLESQVTVIKQEKVPAFFDNEARLAFKREKETFTIDAKPHGHGDIHILLNQRGLPRQWVDEGRRWVFFFQDTNVLVSHALPVLLGASAAHGLAMNTLTVPRNPGEAVGAVCRLIPVDPNDKHHFPMTINVEYNRLAAVLGDQDVPDPSTGKSPYPGNTNVLVFNLVRYRDAVEKTKGIVPEFVNPKYLDATKTIFKSSARLECLMQDFPRLLDPSDPVRFALLAVVFFFLKKKKKPSHTARFDYLTFNECTDSCLRPFNCHSIFSGRRHGVRSLGMLQHCKE